MRKNVAGQRFTFSLFKNGARIASPTLAAGDFKVDIDGAGQNNVAVLPTSDAMGKVVWLPSQGETNGTYIAFLANDAAGTEWEPLTVEFLTTPETSIAAIEGYTDDIGIAGAGLTALGDTRLTGLAQEATLTTILARLGAWTGTGLNTILGALRALANKAVGITTPTDLSSGGTFDNTTDSVEAIRDAAYTGGAVASVTGSVGGDVAGKVLGGGASVIAAVGARVVDASGNNVAPAATALTSAIWTNARALLLNNLVSLNATITGIPPAVWAYAWRTLSYYAVVGTTDQPTGTSISRRRGDTWSIDIVGMGNITARTKLWFTIKKSADDTDPEAMILITETGGLLYVSGIAYAIAAHGSITVTDAVVGNATIYVHEAATAQVSVPGTRRYDMQMKTAVGVYTKAEGDFDLLKDVTRATT